MIAAGKMNKRAEIQALPVKPATSNDFNEPTDDYTTFLTVWVQLTPMSGQELFFAQQVDPNVTHKLLMRWIPASATPSQQGINPKMRFLIDGKRIFNILSVTNGDDERNREIKALVKEVI